jgi:hypothetical protein
MHARYFINVHHAVELIHKELACYKKLVCELLYGLKQSFLSLKLVAEKRCFKLLNGDL